MLNAWFFLLVTYIFLLISYYYLLSFTYHVFLSTKGKKKSIFIFCPFRCGIEYPYLPPELCYSRRRNDVLVDPIGVDLWSLGIMTLQLFPKNMLQVELGNNVMLWSSEVYAEIFEEVSVHLYFWDVSHGHKSHTFYKCWKTSI